MPEEVVNLDKFIPGRMPAWVALDIAKAATGVALFLGHTLIELVEVKCTKTKVPWTVERVYPRNPHLSAQKPMRYESFEAALEAAVPNIEGFVIEAGHVDKNKQTALILAEQRGVACATMRILRKAKEWKRFTPSEWRSVIQQSYTLGGQKFVWPQDTEGAKAMSIALAKEHLVGDIEMSDNPADAAWLGRAFVLTGGLQL